MTTTANANELLPVMEAFYSIQGEGYHQGRAAYFIRLGGCDVGCVWCDVKDSWDASKHPLQSIDTIVENAKAFPGRLAIITGGEPLLHPLDKLTAALHAAGLRPGAKQPQQHHAGDVDRTAAGSACRDGRA